MEVPGELPWQGPEGCLTSHSGRASFLSFQSAGWMSGVLGVGRGAWAVGGCTAGGVQSSRLRTELTGAFPKNACCQMSGLPGCNVTVLVQL